MHRGSSDARNGVCLGVRGEPLAKSLERERGRDLHSRACWRTIKSREEKWKKFFTVGNAEIRWWSRLSPARR